MQNSDHVSLREFLEEKLQHLSTRVTNLDAKFDAALIAQEKATAQAFAASEKAIVKSEDAQRELNIKNNEFRGQLKDQSTLFMPSAEAKMMFTNFDEKLNALRNEFESKLSLSTQDIPGLRESRSESGGKSVGMHASWGIMLGAASLISTILSIAAVLISLFR